MTMGLVTANSAPIQADGDESGFRRARATAETEPAAIVTDHHQPYVRAAQQNLPGSLHIRTGLHRLAGETTKLIERSRIATRDRLRASRGLKTTPDVNDSGRLRGDARSAARCRSAVAGAWLPTPLATRG